MQRGSKLKFCLSLLLTCCNLTQEVQTFSSTSNWSDSQATYLNVLPFVFFIQSTSRQWKLTKRFFVPVWVWPGWRDNVEIFLEAPSCKTISFCVSSCQDQLKSKLWSWWNLNRKPELLVQCLAWMSHRAGIWAYIPWVFNQINYKFTACALGILRKKSYWKILWKSMGVANRDSEFQIFQKFQLSI